MARDDRTVSNQANNVAKAAPPRTNEAKARIRRELDLPWNEQVVTFLLQPASRAQRVQHQRYGRLVIGSHGFSRVIFVLLTLAIQSLWAPERVLPKSVSGIISGQIDDFRLGHSGRVLATNRFSFKGFYRDGNFLVDLEPIASEDDIQESVAWSENLYLIQRFPVEPGKGLPREKALAYIEPTIFSRYATHATAALVMALANSNAVSMLTNATGPPTLLGTIRQYPEEKSHYILNYTCFGGWSVKTICPGFVVGEDNKLIPLDSPVYADGFLRWRFSSKVTDRTDTGLFVHFTYERFRPKYKAQNPAGRDDLIKDRQVEGNMGIEYTEIDAFDFRPKIKEPSLTVLDFRGRREFMHAMGSYEKDYFVQHELTNQSWSLDERDVIKSIARTELGIQVMAKKQERYPSFRWLFYLGVVAFSAFLLVIALKQNAKRRTDSAQIP